MTSLFGTILKPISATVTESSDKAQDEALPATETARVVTVNELAIVVQREYLQRRDQKRANLI